MDIKAIVKAVFAALFIEYALPRHLSRILNFFYDLKIDHH